MLIERQMAVWLLMKIEDRGRVSDILFFIFGKRYSEDDLNQIRLPEKPPTSYPHMFWGYASMKSRDLSGDEIQDGAYNVPSGDILPVTDGHEQMTAIGVVPQFREEEFGLIVAGYLSAPPKYNGLSIAYITKEFIQKRPSGRILKNIDIWNIGIVATPMNAVCRLQYI